MKNRMSVSELSEKLGYPSGEAMQSLRLWKAFAKLSPPQRSKVVDMVERLVTDPAPLPGDVKGQRDPH